MAGRSGSDGSHDQLDGRKRGPKESSDGGYSRESEECSVGDVDFAASTELPDFTLLDLLYPLANLSIGENNGGMRVVRVVVCILKFNTVKRYISQTGNLNP